MNYIKNNYKNLLIVLVYITLANIVYISLAHILWNRWYLDLLIGLIITGIGAVIGYFYLKGEENNKSN